MKLHEKFEYVDKLLDLADDYLEELLDLVIKSDDFTPEHADEIEDAKDQVVSALMKIREFI